MSKDPAVLFYTSDFLTGIRFLTMEQRGQYITLLCEQHQLGHIPENHMISVCGSLDSPVISKFVKDDSGGYYNERMKLEAIKRSNYCKSRSNNKSGRKKKKSYVKSCENHMGEHMENENENENKDVNEDRKYNPLSDCSFFDDKEFKEAWKSWKVVRAKKKCSNSDRAIKIAVKKIMELSKGEKDIAIKIVDQSANSGYSDVWPLKQEKQKSGVIYD